MQAGRLLSAKLVRKYRHEECAILALDDGGVIIGAQLANKLHCIMMLLMTDEIRLPLEPDAIAGITSSGEFAYNTRYSTGEIEELALEYRGLIEQEKLASMHELNRILSRGSVVNKRLLKNKVIIIISEGFKSGFPLDLALAYLKSVNFKKLVIATPLASVESVDRMHVAADEIYCLSVVGDYIDTNHYYDKLDIPDHDSIVRTLKEVLLRWV
jgi:putative phosphoribosyl transferase